MENPKESCYVKRTQKDYTMSFKLQIVQEIERGKLSTDEACRNAELMQIQQLNASLLSQIIYINKAFKFGFYVK